MSKYEVADTSVHQMLAQVVSTHPDKFIHVNPDDVHAVFKDSLKSSWRARIRIVSGYLSTLTNKKFVLEVHKADWDSSTTEERALVVFHELMHIVFDEEKNKYKLRKHDVQDFYEVLKKFGLDKENINEVLKK